MSKTNQKSFLILIGVLSLIILFLNIGFVSAVACWVQSGTSPSTAASNCRNSQINGTNGSVIMYLSGTTNTHGALESQATYNNVLCCSVGAGSTTCDGTNKILGLSSARNAHAERPEFSNYTGNNVCYSSLINSFAASGTSPGENEVKVIPLSSGTNAHIGAYNLTVYSEVSLPIFCDLTSASWQSTETLNGTSVVMLVGGTNCGGETISFEVKRGSTSCGSGSLSDCIPPANVPFGQNGLWTAGPASDTNYSFTATVVGTSETQDSSNELHVLASCPYEPPPVLCSGYTNANDCNSNICGGVVFPPEDINPRCSWIDNQCNLVSDPPQEVSIVVNPQNPAIDIGLVKTFTADVYLDGVLDSTEEPCMQFQGNQRRNSHYYCHL